MNSRKSEVITAPLVGPSDLIITALTAPATAMTGTNIALSNTAKNQRAAKSDGFYVGLYISSDNNITTADTRIGRRHINSLDAGASSSSSTTVAISRNLTAGNYFLGAIADYSNIAEETNENNNTKATPVTISVGADLIVSALSSPTTATRGTSISINNTVKNQGVGSAASSKIGIYLSSDISIDTNDRRIGSRPVGRLVLRLN